MIICLSLFIHAINFYTTDCVKQAFRKHQKAYKIQCSTPWHQSMLGNVSSLTWESCSNSEKKKQVALDSKFIRESLAYQTEFCQGA